MANVTSASSKAAVFGPNSMRASALALELAEPLASSSGRIRCRSSTLSYSDIRLLSPSTYTSIESSLNASAESPNGVWAVPASTNAIR